jgi:hypothetical protein
MTTTKTQKWITAVNVNKFRDGAIWNTGKICYESEQILTFFLVCGWVGGGGTLLLLMHNRYNMD